MTNNIGAIILAAGFSNRYGGMKLCAELNNGNTVIQETLSNIKFAGLPALVITRPELTPLLQLTDANIETFDEAERGMGATLAFGVLQIPREWDGCLVCLADMPFIESSTYRQIADRLDKTAIVIPWFENRPGNPVGFGRDFFPRLQALQGDAGGRRITEAHADAVVEMQIDDPAILNDIDTPADLTRFQR